LAGRLIYQDWIAELGRDPDRNLHVTADIAQYQAPDDELEQAVRQALKTLTEPERSLIIWRYYMGQSCRRIAEISGRAECKLTSLHRRALRKLRKQLASFVRRRYNIRRDVVSGCPICRSPDRLEIDGLVQRRDRSRSWKPVMAILKNRYSVVIKTPSVLIGHEKYH
jgi:hypothetical protein